MQAKEMMSDRYLGPRVMETRARMGVGMGADVRACVYVGS